MTEIVYRERLSSHQALQDPAAEPRPERCDMSGTIIASLTRSRFSLTIPPLVAVAACASLGGYRRERLRDAETGAKAPTPTITILIWMTTTLIRTSRPNLRMVTPERGIQANPIVPNGHRGDRCPGSGDEWWPFAVPRRSDPASKTLYGGNGDMPVDFFCETYPLPGITVGFCAIDTQVPEREPDTSRVMHAPDWVSCGESRTRPEAT